MIGYAIQSNLGAIKGSKSNKQPKLVISFYSLNAKFWWKLLVNHRSQLVLGIQDIQSMNFFNLGVLLPQWEHRDDGAPSWWWCSLVIEMTDNIMIENSNKHIAKWLPFILGRFWWSSDYRQLKLRHGLSLSIIYSLWRTQIPNFLINLLKILFSFGVNFIWAIKNSNR